MKRYAEMEPFRKDWHKYKFGPMRYRVKARNKRLSLLEEAVAETGDIELNSDTDKKLPNLDS